jgi:2,4-dichlorophenol 6-monooxygenase
LHYVAGSAPGVRLPHAWLLKGREQVSSLDVLDYGEFLLIVDPSWSAEWNEALERARLEGRMPLRLVTVGFGDADFVPKNCGWMDVRGVGASGALLIRPDGHVVWRTRAIPPDPSVTLSGVIAKLSRTLSSVPELVTS